MKLQNEKNKSILAYMGNFFRWTLIAIITGLVSGAWASYL